MDFGDDLRGILRFQAPELVEEIDRDIAVFAIRSAGIAGAEQHPGVENAAIDPLLMNRLPLFALHLDGFEGFSILRFVKAYLREFRYLRLAG